MSGKVGSPMDEDDYLPPYIQEDSEDSQEPSYQQMLKWYQLLSGRNLLLCCMLLLLLFWVQGNRKVSFPQEGFMIDYGSQRIIYGETILYFEKTASTVTIYPTKLDRDSQVPTGVQFRKVAKNLPMTADANFQEIPGVDYYGIARGFFPFSSSSLPTLHEMLMRPYFYFLLPGIILIVAPKLLIPLGVVMVLRPPRAWGRTWRKYGYSYFKYDEHPWDKKAHLFGVIFLCVAFILYLRWHYFGY